MDPGTSAAVQAEIAKALERLVLPAHGIMAVELSVEGGHVVRVDTYVRESFLVRRPREAAYPRGGGLTKPHA